MPLMDTFWVQRQTVFVSYVSFIFYRQMYFATLGLTLKNAVSSDSQMIPTLKMASATGR